MQLFHLSLSSLMFRFYFMMALVIAGIAFSQYWLLAIAFLVFMSCLLGIRINERGMISQSGTIIHKFGRTRAGKNVKEAA